MFSVNITYSKGNIWTVRYSIKKSLRTNSNIQYCKILIISPRAYFWSKGLFETFFLGGGGGGLIFGGTYTWTDICVLKTLFFVQAVVILGDFLLTACLYY